MPGNTTTLTGVFRNSRQTVAGLSLGHEQFPARSHTTTLCAPPSEAPPKEIIALPWAAPVRWLGLGWRDLAAHPAISLFYGWRSVHGLDSWAVFRAKPEYTMTIASGCLLVGHFWRWAV